MSSESGAGLGGGGGCGTPLGGSCNCADSYLASPPRLGDLGLEQFSVSELFSSILVPGFFLLACILQLHYFHRPFMQLTDPEHRPQPGACIPRWVPG